MPPIVSRPHSADAPLLACPPHATVKASAAPAASSTCASAIEMPTGPATVADAEFDSARSSSVSTDPAGSRIVTVS